MNLKENQKEMIQKTMKSAGMVLLLLLLIMVPSQKIFADEVVRVVRNKQGEWAINEDEKSYMIYRWYKGFKYTRSTKGAIISAYAGKKKKVTVPKKIKGLKVTAIISLKKAKTLEEIRIPATVTQALNLSGVRNLKKITIDKKNPVFKSKNNLIMDKKGTTIYFCPAGLTKVTIPKTVKRIADEAFAYSKIKTIKIPDRIEKIGRSAFMGSQLRTVTLPKNMKEIGDGIFAGSKLEKITIPDTVEKIKSGAFSGTDLREIVIPKNVKVIDTIAFSYCKKLKKVTFQTEKLTKIGHQAFCGCISLVEMKIPDTVKWASSDTFLGCTGLKKLELSNRMKEVQWNMVDDCTALEEVILPASVEKIGWAAFDDCKDLKKIYIYNKDCEIEPPEHSAVTISETALIYSYEGSTAETYAKQYGYKFVPLSHKNYEGYNYTVSEKGVMIQGYDGDKKQLIIPEQIEGKSVVGIYSLGGYNEVEKVHIPATVTEELDLFGAVMLKTVTIDTNNLSYMAVNNLVMDKNATTVYDCPWNLSDVVIPATVQVVEEGAFEHCKIKKIIVPENVTEIKSSAFKECRNLEEITFNTNKLKVIAEKLFYRCTSLKEIAIPASVKKIEADVFYNCEKLEKLYVYSKTCKLAKSDYFYNAIEIPDQTKVYGYKGSTIQKYVKQFGQPFTVIK